MWSNESKHNQEILHHRDLKILKSYYVQDAISKSEQFYQAKVLEEWRYDGRKT